MRHVLADNVKGFEPVGDINDSIRSIILGAIGQIPEVGSLLAGLTAALWPDGSQSVWDQIKDQVEQLVHQEISQTLYEELQQDLQGLQDAIQQYTTAIQDPNISPDDKKENYTSCSYVFTYAAPHFQVDGFQALLLPLFAQMANLHLSLLRDGVQFGASWGMSPDEVSDISAQLVNTIQSYTGYASGVFSGQLASYPYDSQSMSDWNQITSYRTQTILNVMDYAYYWQFFDVTLYPDPITPPPPSRLIYSNLIGTITDNNSPRDPRQLPSEVSSVTTMTGVLVNWDTYVRYMSWGGTSCGWKGGSQTNSYAVTASNPIVTVSGRAGDVVDMIQLGFLDGTVTPTLGGPGGNGYSWSFPNEYLVGFVGIDFDWNNSINAIGSIALAFGFLPASDLLSPPMSAPVVDTQTFAQYEPFPENDPTWPSNTGVSYAIKFFSENAVSIASPWSEPAGAGYALPQRISIPVDPTGTATGRQLYRRFHLPDGQVTQAVLVLTIENNADIVCSDNNY